MAAERLACLLVPLFPLAARLRSEPELMREATAVFDGNGNTARLVAANRTARLAGLRPGLTLPQARARLPKLVARARDAECEKAAQEALLEAAESLSPRLEDAGEGIAYADLEGLERHFPGGDFEPRIAQALLDALEQVGLPTRVGIAGSKLTARIAAEAGPSPAIILPGEEASFLAPLPLGRLSTEAGALSTLERWGIRSIGQLANLSPAEVSSRLGRAGRELHAIARGIDPRPLVPRCPPPTFREGMSLEWPLVALEPFLFVARAALDRLRQRLQAQGLAARALELSLRLDPDGYDERSLALPAPTRDVKTLLTLVRLELEARAPGAPVRGFRFTARSDRPRQAQLTLFGPTELSPDRLAGTLARLFALLGPGRVGAPQPLDGHRPEGFALEEFRPPPPPDRRRDPSPGRGLLTIRALRPPVPLEVITAGQGPLSHQGPKPGEPSDVPAETAPEQPREQPEEQPENQADTIAEDAALYGEAPPELHDLRLLQVRSTVDGDRKRRPRIDGRIRVASGPWRLEEAWWSEEPVARDYWDVELASGLLVRLYRRRSDGEWFADGLYD